MARDGDVLFEHVRPDTGGEKQATGEDMGDLSQTG
jgi:hypothetical protein